MDSFSRFSHFSLKNKSGKFRNCRYLNNCANFIVWDADSCLFLIPSSIKSKRAEREKEIEQELRKQKAPIYEEFISFLSKIQNASKNEETIPENEMLDFVVNFNKKMIVWGGDEVMRAWSNFKDNSQNIQNYLILFSMEDVWFAIRADMGHSNKGLKRGDLLALYVTDIDKVLNEVTLESAEQILQKLRKRI